jgi:malate dehydrogenase (oxaloacetate-decarboxylating)
VVLIEWTERRALVATGSPFPPVRYAGQAIQIGQCNNTFIFPGVGLGVIATNARRVTDAMFVVAARVLGTLSPARSAPTASLFPPVEGIRAISRQVALAVGAEAQRAGLAESTTAEELERRVNAAMWTPKYPRLKASVA